MIYKLNINKMKGKFFLVNQDFYEGEFKNDVKNGFGIYRFKDGKRYEGEWKNNFKNGIGKI